MTDSCSAFYDDEDRGFSCEREPGHEPPHREVQDWRVKTGNMTGTGYVLTMEWWTDWLHDDVPRWN